MFRITANYFSEFKRFPFIFVGVSEGCEWRLKKTLKKVSKELAQGRRICRLRSASPATGSARETKFSGSRLGLTAEFNFPRTRSFTQHDLVKMRASLLR